MILFEGLFLPFGIKEGPRMLFLINCLENSPHFNTTHQLILAVPKIRSTEMSVIFVAQASLGAAGLPAVNQPLAEIFHRFAPHKQFSEKPKISFSPCMQHSLHQRKGKTKENPPFFLLFLLAGFLWRSGIG